MGVAGFTYHAAVARRRPFVRGRLCGTLHQDFVWAMAVDLSPEEILDLTSAGLDASAVVSLLQPKASPSRPRLTMPYTIRCGEFLMKPFARRAIAPFGCPNRPIGEAVP